MRLAGILRSVGSTITGAFFLYLSVMMFSAAFGFIPVREGARVPMERTTFALYGVPCLLFASSALTSLFSRYAARLMAYGAFIGIVILANWLALVGDGDWLTRCILVAIVDVGLVVLAIVVVRSAADPTHDSGAALK